jgi:predicted amidophosphoribosyltransferase
MLRALAHAALSILAPPRCAACDVRLIRDAALCAGCLATLEPPPPLPVGTSASFAFGGALADAVRATKFGPRPERMRALQRLVIERLHDAHGGHGAVDVVAPVPLHRARLRERGFDQAAMLAQAVAAALGKPCDVTLLTRRIDTPHVAALDAPGRAQAVSGAFSVRGPRAAQAWRSVLLIDDVRTTGATLEAAARPLRAAGVEVRAHVLAATAME